MLGQPPEQLLHCMLRSGVHACDWYCSPDGHVSARHGAHTMSLVAVHGLATYCPSGHIVLHRAHAPLLYAVQGAFRY